MADEAGTTSVLPESWLNYITPFARSIGKTPEDVTEALKSLVGDPGDEAVGLLQDEKFTSFDEIKAKVGTDVPAAKLKKAVAGLRKVVKAEAPAAPIGSVPLFDVLPSVPSDESWLAGLKTGGVLKPSKETVIGTVSAALADRVGLYDLPGKIVEAMEGHADSLDEPVPLEFFTVQRSLTERSYAELFAAIPGATGKYATQKRKNELLRKLEENLWGSLVSFQGQLKGVFDSWQQSSSSPAVVMGAITALVSGGGVSPGMMQFPPTDSLRDAAEGVITSINRIFSGVGGMVAMALAYDAQQIRLALENPTLPAHIGAANRDQMLRQLGVAVSSDYPRLELNLKKYTLGVIELPNVTAGQTEINYVTALYQLGCQIPWDKLTTRGLDTTAGGKRGKEFKSF